MYILSLKDEDGSKVYYKGVNRCMVQITTFKKDAKQFITLKEASDKVVLFSQVLGDFEACEFKIEKES